MFRIPLLLLFFAIPPGGAGGRETHAFGDPIRTGMESAGDSAVVIGIEEYAFIPPVPYAKRDAAAMYDVMVYTRGIPPSRVQLLTQSPSREEIRDAVERAGRETGPGGTVWVFYAGHGAGSPEDGERILLGADVKQDASSFVARSVAVADISRLAAAGGGRVVLMTDTCYTGAGRGGEELVAGKRFLVPAYAQVDAPRVLEWVAASAGQMSGPLEPVQHGAFTFFTVEALRGAADGELSGAPDGQVSMSEVQAYVTRRLRDEQNYTQVPQLLGDKGDWALVTGVDASAAKPAEIADTRPTRRAAEAAPSPAPSIAPAPGDDRSQLGLEAGLPLGLRAEWDTKGDRAVQEWGVRVVMGLGVYALTSPGAILGPMVYADYGQNTWQLELSAGGGLAGSSAGVLVGVAAQYDPPTPFQLNLGLIGGGFTSLILAPDITAGFLW